jgi:hypothetical protein
MESDLRVRNSSVNTLGDTAVQGYDFRMLDPSVRAEMACLGWSGGRCEKKLPSLEVSEVRKCIDQTIDPMGGKQVQAVVVCFL